MRRAKSATAFNREQLFTKTELIELLASISINDVWSAEYQTFDKTNDWQKELAVTIHGLSVAKASDYIKKHFGTFEKTNRTIIGHKINPVSDNNYYLVRDLAVHFDLLEKVKGVNEAENRSIRNLDVNTSTIFFKLVLFSLVKSSNAHL